ncbi:MAG: restriction endonuclease subunit S, partial [Synergistota bacterium]|nr:restriction endonuclease subunit S [Synergistota bacterium]
PSHTRLGADTGRPDGILRGQNATETLGLNPDSGLYTKYYALSCKGIVSPAYAVFRPASNEIFSKYLHYLTRSEIYVGLFGSWSYGVIPSRWRLYPEVFLKLPILLPPIKEQIAIAGFLDKKTSAIDNLIQKKQRQIELLQEKRGALITHAVTKGLDPDVRMKDSGVEWLGEVPEHWVVERLKYLSSINDESLPETTDPSFVFEYVDIGNVDTRYGIVKTEHYSFSEAPSRARRIVRPGDTIVSTVRTYLKAIAYIEKSKENVVVSTGFAVIRPKGIRPSFLSYALLSNFFIDNVVSRSEGISYPAISQSQISNIVIPLPDNAEEQQSIADFLDCKTARIDALVDKINQSISTLHEYRSALITAAVTGKIDVRESVA